MARAARVELCYHFTDVFALCGELARAFGILEIVAKQVAVFLHIGATSSGVSDNCRNVGLLKNVNRFLSKRDSRRFFPRMHEQRSAASLRFRSNDLAAFCGEHASGGGVHLREKLALHTTEEQTNAAAFCANGRSDFQDGFLWAKFREQRFHGPQFFWEKFQ